MMKKLALILVLLQIFSLISCDLLPHIDSAENSKDDSNQTSVLGDNESPDISAEEPDTNDDNVDASKDNLDIKNDKEETKSNDLFIYEVIENAIVLVKYIGDDNFVHIPLEIDGMPVVKIASGAFIDNQTVSISKSKMLANGLEEDENIDFGVYIPESVENIENGAFPKGCVFISNASKKKDGWKDDEIKGNASSEKNDGGNVYFEYSKEDVCVEGGLMFVYNDNQQGYFLTKCLKQKKNIEIPAYVNGKPVIHIGQRAFYGNKHVKSVVIPETVAYIWHSAFMYCTSLERIICNSTNLSKILSYSFAECISLNEVVLPSFLTYIQSYGFMNCGTISKMTVPSSLITVSSNVFAGTIIEEIEYLGTEKHFNDMKIGSGNEGFLNASINFLPPEDILVLDDIKELKNIEYGSQVQIEGYVSMFSGSKYLFLINEDNSFGVQVYTSFYYGEKPPRFSKVRIIATWTKYTGQDQLSSIESIEIIQENAMSILPIEVTIDDIERNPELYQNRYLLFTGNIHSTVSYPAYTYFTKDDGSRSNIMLYSSQLDDTGETVQFIATVIRYNNIMEMLSDDCGMDFYNYYFKQGALES